MSRLTEQELEQITRDVLREYNMEASVSVSPMGPAVEEAQEIEPEPEAEPVRKRTRPIPWYRNPYGNNKAFAVLVIFELSIGIPLLNQILRDVFIKLGW